MIATSGLLVFQLGGLRHFVPVPAANIQDVLTWREKLQPYSWATITNWYFIQSDAFDVELIAPGEIITVETYLRAEFENEAYEPRFLKIPAPKSENFEDQTDRGNRLTEAAGSALASVYHSITGETVSFIEGALFGGSPLK